MRTHRADIFDFEAIRTAFEDQDVVLHLAAKPGENYTWEELLDTNVEDARHVFRAAFEAGVQRVVFASSGATIAGWEQDEPCRSLVVGKYEDLPDAWPIITVDMPSRPRCICGSTKVRGEALADHCGATTGVSFVTIWIGFVNLENRPTNARQRSVWCSQRDVVNAIEASVNGPLSLKDETFFANSANGYSYRDLRHGANRL